ncbi:MAG: shikimate kinase, partial [Oceanospirillum sp.]|nr:shikimate kinase [Oceanospirillum sp.]
MHYNHNIVLVGPMGAGKSTIGRLLATELGLPFFDSDREIEARSGANIPWIFDVEGEDGFRRRETQTIIELLQEEGPIVLATGGGAIMRPENRQSISQSSTVIYL